MIACVPSLIHSPKSVRPCSYMPRPDVRLRAWACLHTPGAELLNSTAAAPGYPRRCWPCTRTCPQAPHAMPTRMIAPCTATYHKVLFRRFEAERGHAFEKVGQVDGADLLLIERAEQVDDP